MIWSSRYLPPVVSTLLIAAAPLGWLATPWSVAPPTLNVRPMTTANVATLIRQPYLQQVGGESATVLWATRESGVAEVRYRAGVDTVAVPATTTLFPSAYTGMARDYYQHEATLTGLSAATTYEYDVLLDGVDATAATDRLTTAPPPGSGRISFVAFGDSGSGTANQLQLAQQMAERFAAGRWNLALHTGDVVYPKDSYQLLHDRFFDVYGEWLRRYPVFPAIGNHEDYANKGRPYLDLFSLPENGHTALYPDQTERYYSFDYGPVHFVALDTQIAFSGCVSS